jgi:hypothetical protein
MPRALRAPLLAAALWMLAVAPGRPARAAPQSEAPDLSGVMQRVGRYVEEYLQEFSRLVCDERFAQEFRQVRSRASSRGSSFDIERRRLVSEFALARVEGAGGWLWQGFRDVVEVDGRSVRKGNNRLEALFSSSPADLLKKARAIADESARYNLGQYRTINVPTLALEFLALNFQPRQRYEKTGEETVTGVRTWRIAFDEQARPTVIRTPDGGDVPSKGIVWVDPVTGRIIRTQLEPQQGYQDETVTVSKPEGPRQKSTIVVTYAPDPRLGTWVPVEMRESYATAQLSLTGTATYSNFRRFETVARIKDD